MDPVHVVSGGMATVKEAGEFLAVSRSSLYALMEAGKVTPVIDRSYPLSEISQAIGYVGGGHAQGKVVITVLGTTPHVSAAPDPLSATATPSASARRPPRDTSVLPV